ncbi:MAG TPA: sialidase family protein [Bryobacteraceae bacterium]|nr:sialidase family protein [Bryobacteraceae bacterium]
MNSLHAVEAVRIWDKSPYNAFTDLIHYKGRFFCGFREAPTHHAEDGLGSIRILESKDGKTWASIAVLSDPEFDLRDPKFSVTPKGELMMALGAVRPKGKGETRIQTMAYFSRDGKKWGTRVPIGEAGFWLWRITWHQGKAYSVGYQSGRTEVLRLYVSEDGRKFTTLVNDFRIPDYGNEATMVFDKDGTAHCFVRRDGGTMSSMWGTSQAPYTDWKWQDMVTRVGGPHVIQVPDGRYFGVVRYIESGIRRVSVIQIDPATGKMTEIEKLPSSNGDSGYAGLVWKDGALWTSYYSTHENRRTSIFLARWKP